MAKIVLSDIALHGVQNAKEVKTTKKQQEEYDQVVEEVTKSIMKYHAEEANVYQRAKNFGALSSGPSLSLQHKVTNTTRLKSNNKV